MSDNTRFDVVVVGTGLSESIAAASLAKDGLAVLQLDRNDFYGDRHASLTVTEIMEWLDAIGTTEIIGRSRYANAAYSFPSCLADGASTDVEAVNDKSFEASLPRTSRLYSLSLCPALLPARGALVNTLVEQDVGKYVSFRIVDSVGISFENDDGVTFDTLPSSKESIFKDPTLSLMDKRRLMKCLMWIGDAARSTGLMEASEESIKGAASDGDNLSSGRETIPFVDFLTSAFSLPTRLAETIAFGIAHCSTGSEPALPAVKRMNKYLRSAGRYGASPFLVGQYGGVGEVVQAFCRSCAVYGGTYVLGEASHITNFTVLVNPIPVESLPEEAPPDPDAPPKATLQARVSFSIPAFDKPVLAGRIICPPDAPLLAPKQQRPSRLRNNFIGIVGSLPLIARSVYTTAVDPEDVESPSASEESQRDVFLLMFKPKEAGSESVRVLFMGPATGSCPEGQYVMYMQSMGEQDLAPYLSQLYPSEGSQPLFTATYQSISYEHAGKDLDDAIRLIRLDMESNMEPLWLEGLDAEVREAERLVASMT